MKGPSLSRLIILVIPLWGEFQMTGVLIHFSNSCKNDKRNSNLFFNNKQCKNEIQIRFSKWCENENRKMKFKSVFQSEAKTKKEIRSSNPFFKVKRKRKTKSKIQLCFSMSCENEKCKWHLNSLFPCHRKTVGTKVHALLWNSNLFAKFLYAVTWLFQSKKKRLIFQQKHLVYDDCQLSYRVNWKPSLLTYNRLSSSLLAALWTSLAQNIQAG